MHRPSHAWAVVVVGVGILAGCSRKPAATPSGNTSPAPASPDVSAPDGRTAKKGPPVQPAAPPKSGADTPATPQTGGKADEALPGTTTPEAATSRSPGNVEVSLCKFDGIEKAIGKAKGKVVLIDCWATWCGPCVASFPKLVEKHQKYAGKGLSVISLSTDTPADGGKVIAFLKKQNATFLNLHMPLDAAAQKGLQEKFAYHNAIPHAVLFDRTGSRVWAGHPMDPKLTSLIETELTKSGPSS